MIGKTLRKRIVKLKLKSFIVPFLLLFGIFSGGIALSAQEILTATDYFDSISEQYGAVNDYQADITITRDEEEMKGTLYYKNPNLLRIDFSEPEEQVLAIDGSQLTIYLPQHSVIMQQQLKRHSAATISTMASNQGLHLLKRNYSIAYLEGPEPMPLEEGSREMVVKLKLVWRTTNAGFRQLEISVGENGLIRRIIGVTLGYENLQFDFKNLVINRGIPDARFDYESPASANVFDNFLFEPEG